MTIINDIRACLDTHLTGTVGIPTIARQNVPFQPTVGTSFVKAEMVPTSRRPAVRGLNPQKRYDGLYTILICTPEAKGAGAGYDIADSLLARFDAGIDITYNGFIVSIDYSEVRASFLDSPFYCTPVTVGWYIYGQ
ncbi:MAG: phage tail terminator-like protein [Fluviibacter sp.]